MKSINKKLYTLFYSKTKLLQFLAIFLIFLSIGFKITKTEKYWFWSDYPFIAILLVGFSILFVSIWIKIEKNKIQEKVNEIKNKYDLAHIENDNNLNNLTPRQNEVFQLILSDKTNKEIIEKLFIEPSTLKTHINKIYKILEIKNRKELRVKYKNLNQNR